MSSDDESFIKNVIEAALLAAGRPLTVAEIGHLFDESNRPGVTAIREALTALEQDYTGRGIEVKETANGFRIQVRRELANEISRLWPERPPRYSRALLETLALVAYRQPITRAEIEAVRGVAVNPNIIKTLLERNWVKVVGLRDVPGRPELLGTTKDFLDYFGLRSLEELPPLAELKAMGDVNLQLDLSKDPASAAALTADGASDIAADGAAGAEAAGDAAADGAVGASATGDAAADAIDSDAGDEAASGEIVATSDVGQDAESTEAVADTDADSSEDAGEQILTAAEASDAGEESAESAEGAGEGGDEDKAARSATPEREAPGPKVKAAEAFIAEMESEDLDALADDDEDEGSGSESSGSGELVAAPPHNFED